MPMFNKLRRASHCPIQSKKDATKTVEPRSDAEIIERLNSLVIQHFGGKYDNRLFDIHIVMFHFCRIYTKASISPMN